LLGFSKVPVFLCQPVYIYLYDHTTPIKVTMEWNTKSNPCSTPGCYTIRRGQSHQMGEWKG